MGSIQSRTPTLAQFKRRLLKMRQICGDKMEISHQVQREVEHRLMYHEWQPMDALIQHLDLSDLTKPKKAKTEKVDDPYGDAIDHPHYNQLTHDFNQFFYDCIWYEYYLRSPDAPTNKRDASCFTCLYA